MPIKYHSLPTHLKMIGTLIYRYAKRYNAWPSITDIVRVGKEQRIGGRFAVYTKLLTMQQAGILELKRKGEESGWKITPAGYDWMHREPLRLKPELAIRRRDRRKPHKLRAKRIQVKRQLSTDTHYTFDTETLSVFPYVETGEYGNERAPIIE